MNAERGTAVHKVDTVLNADAVEWCPYPGYQHVLLCGTYKLLEPHQARGQDSQPTSEPDVGVEDNLGTVQVRVGGVTAYQILFPDETKPYLQECGNMSLCGVLDIKWAKNTLGDKFVYGVVDAEGQLQVFQIRDDYTSEFLAKGKLSESSLGLSLCWTGHSDGLPLIAASDSAGCVSVFQIGDDVRAMLSWQAHGYEAWITAFHKSDSNIVYSGGDDCQLKSWDLRNTSQPIFCSKRHEMGVCSIESHPFNDHLFASGSYDEKMMVWDRRQLKQPVNSSTLGGGVWRIKWDPFSGSRILTATMYNGAHIVDCSNLGQDALPIVAQYDDHNLAYGADWCRLGIDGKSRASSLVTTCDFSGKTDTFLISTCSFYDHSLHLWEWSSPIK